MPSGTVIVSAGYQGIGRAIANRFVDGGFRVFACDIAAPAGSDLRDSELFVPVHLDASDPEAVIRFVSSLSDRNEQIDVLVNNVGISGPTRPIEEIAVEDWRAVLDTNLSSAFYFIKAVLPAMKARRSGAIINIATSSAKTGMTNRTPYVASKGGLIALSHNVAREAGPFGVRSNVISPGAIENERGRLILDRIAGERGVTVEEARAEMLSHISMRTTISPDEVADMAFFLASPSARHVSGQNIGVCGNVEWEA